ncbi:MAG: sensor histidine kinase [Verrucomicrobiales bacterium]
MLNSFHNQQPNLSMTAVTTDQAMFVFPDRLDIQKTPTGEFYTLFLRGLTHKLNNMLAVFQGFSSLLLMNDDLDASSRESLSHMKGAAQNAQGLAERIVAAGGCARLTLQRVQLSEYLSMIDSALREPFEKHSVPFELRADPDLPVVEIDGARFKELLVEILRNAAEAVSEGGDNGEASMEIYGPGRSPEDTFDRIDVFVHSTGTIREDKIQEIFKPFVSTKDGSHYGIGLTVAAMLAQQMGLTLGARSEDNRTTFWLSIPVAA